MQGTTGREPFLSVFLSAERRGLGRRERAGAARLLHDLDVSVWLRPSHDVRPDGEPGARGRGEAGPAAPASPRGVLPGRPRPRPHVRAPRPRAGSAAPGGSRAPARGCGPARARRKRFPVRGPASPSYEDPPRIVNNW